AINDIPEHIAGVSGIAIVDHPTWISRHGPVLARLLAHNIPAYFVDLQFHGNAYDILGYDTVSSAHRSFCYCFCRFLHRYASE
ncbi:MAG: hypothetical protein AAB359_05445, partial [Elusimicrobiota bacterium]